MNRDELIEALELANGKDDCTCSVAANSNNPAEHDRYCAFPLLRRAAKEITAMQAALAKIADPLAIQVEGSGFSRSLKLINAMAFMAKEAATSHLADNH